MPLLYFQQGKRFGKGNNFLNKTGALQYESITTAFEAHWFVPEMSNLPSEGDNNLSVLRRLHPHQQLCSVIIWRDRGTAPRRSHSRAVKTAV